MNPTEKRRARILKMLDEDPDIERAYYTDIASDRENVVLAVGIRGVATFDMLIPRGNYDPMKFMEMIK